MSSATGERPPGRNVATALGVMLAVAAAMGLLVAGLIIPFAGVTGLAAKGAADTLKDLPANFDTGELAQRSTLLDKDGEVIATLYDENRVNVTLSQVSKPMRQAILAIEDDRFYQHGALDMKGTLRAFITNQTNQGTVQGGSSITQQLVKLTLLSQAGTDKKKVAEATADTYARKFKELRYAIALEQTHSKDWILERYLNSAYFGAGAHGVQAAARRYFDKNASKLSVREAATIAGLVKNPVGYDPIRNPERSMQRRNVVLDRMAELGVITATKADRLKKQKLRLNPRTSPNGCTQSKAPFFCDYVLNYLESDPALGKTVADRQRLLKSGGLTIHTTVDLKMNKAATDSVEASVHPTDNAIGALAMVEPGTGEVRAIAQSRPMGSKVGQGQTYLNYVVNQKYGDSAGFSAGSTFKAFTLAAAIELGIPLTTTINSPPQMNIPESSYTNCKNEPYGYGTWDVSNSTSSGPMTLYTGTQLSVNTFFAQLEIKTGLCKPFRLAKSMGVDLDQATGDANGLGAELVPSFTLGAANASPLEMAEAYATFAARGKHCDARPVTSVEDADGKRVKSYPDVCSQVIPESVADGVSAILRGVLEPGGFGYQQGINLPIDDAGKTGTAQNQQAVWFVGYTPTMSAAAMIAGANSQGQPISLRGQTIGGVYRPSASGSGFAGPIWGNTMKAILPELGNEKFVPFSQSAVNATLDQVPDVRGMSISDAKGTLADKGFNVVVGENWNTNYPAGTVGGMDPTPGEARGQGYTVTLYPSTGYVPPPPSSSTNKGNKGKGKGHGKGRQGRGRG